jgi:HAD superfamily hydrolase (TIGR01549 family)
LVDDHSFYELADRVVLELLASSGRDVPKEEYQALVQGLIARLYPNPRRAAIWHFLKPDLEGYHRAVEELRRRRQEWKAERLQPGALEAVAALSGRYQLALAGNQPAAIKELLESSEVLRYFRFRLVSEEMGVAKPDPLFFQVILDSLEVGPEEAAMVGDRLDLDTFPAKLLGLLTVRVLVGPYAKQEPLTPAHEPDLEVGSLGELPQALAELSWKEAKL